MNVETNNYNIVFIDVIHKTLIKGHDKGSFVVVRLLCFTRSDIKSKQTVRAGYVLYIIITGATTKNDAKLHGQKPVNKLKQNISKYAKIPIEARKEEQETKKTNSKIIKCTTKSNHFDYHSKYKWSIHTN